MSRWGKALVLGGLHFVLQIFIYALAFALGPGTATRRLLGISLYDFAVVITFPFVYLAEKFQWSGLGMSVFLLNSIVWATVFYLILVVIAKFAAKKDF